MPATFGGIAIFGRGVKMPRALNPRDEQRSASPGVNGQGSMDMGFRGRTFRVSGALFGLTAFDLNTAIAVFESFYDGQAYYLVDTFGNSWPYVKMESFEPSPVRFDLYRGYFVTYTATFHQLRN